MPAAVRSMGLQVPPGKRAAVESGGQHKWSYKPLATQFVPAGRPGLTGSDCRIKPFQRETDAVEQGAKFRCDAA